MEGQQGDHEHSECDHETDSLKHCHGTTSFHEEMLPTTLESLFYCIHIIPQNMIEANIFSCVMDRKMIARIRQDSRLSAADLLLISSRQKYGACLTTILPSRTIFA